MKRIIALTLALALAASAFYYVPKYCFEQGITYKVMTTDTIRSTPQGGLALYMTVADADGNTYNALTGYIAKWDIKPGHYISAQKITIMENER